MRRNTTFLYSTIIINFIVNFSVMKAGLPINITSINCDYNELCKKPLCFLNTVRNKISFLNVGCFFDTPIVKPILKLQAFRRSGNKYQPWVLNVAEDICKILNNTGWTKITARIMPIVTKCRVPTKCPLKGDNTVQNCPLDLSFFPVVLPNGDYMLRSDLSGFGKNESILRTELYFAIRY